MTSSRSDARGIATRALATGSVASLVSSLGLVIAAEAEGRAPLQPLNATSHWLHGDDAALTGHLDLVHTGVGYATNHSACLFWAVIFEVWQAYRPAPTAGLLLRDGLVMAAVAAAVDYGATPKRFTPGWELVLTRTGMAGAYTALAIGLATGSAWGRRDLGVPGPMLPNKRA